MRMFTSFPVGTVGSYCNGTGNEQCVCVRQPVNAMGRAPSLTSAILRLGCAAAEHV